MALPAEALELIKGFEGYLRSLGDGTDRVKPYLCPANVATIGWGCTRYPDGRPVKMGDPPISKATATEYLAHELRQDEAAFDRLNTRRLQVLSRGALVSFTYNCGSGAYRASNLRRAVNEGRWSDVPGELRKWRMGGGRILPGLVRRREAESGLFMKGVRLSNEGPFVEPGGEPIGSPPAPQMPVPPTPAQPTWWQRTIDWIFK